MKRLIVANWKCNPTGLEFTINLGALAAHGCTDPNNYFLPNKWNHYLGTYDGSEMKIYINGTEVCTPSLVTAGNLSTTNHVAQILPGTTDKVFDEVRIYNTSLSSAQVKQHYAEGMFKRELAEVTK